MDASAHEDATIIHDLNEPVRPELHGCYDAVIDGGSLEHIFSVPIALANLMRMAMVQARKLRHLEDPFAVPPQQSDYTARWNLHGSSGPDGGAAHAARGTWLPPRVRRVLAGVREIVGASRFNRRVYTRSS